MSSGACWTLVRTCIEHINHGRHNIATESNTTGSFGWEIFNTLLILIHIDKQRVFLFFSLLLKKEQQCWLRFQTIIIIISVGKPFMDLLSRI